MLHVFAAGSLPWLLAAWPSYRAKALGRAPFKVTLHLIDAPVHVLISAGAVHAIFVLFDEVPDHALRCALVLKSHHRSLLCVSCLCGKI